MSRTDLLVKGLILYFLFIWPRLQNISFCYSLVKLANKFIII
nr:MAG TPA: hypothetical protein [Caudoviricetes sp.]